MRRRADLGLQAKVKCLHCGAAFSDWDLLLAVPKRSIACKTCGSSHRVIEKGMRLSILIPILSTLAAAVLSGVLWIFEMNLLLELAILACVIFAVVKLSIRWGLRLSPSGS